MVQLCAFIGLSYINLFNVDQHVCVMSVYICYDLYQKVIEVGIKIGIHGPVVTYITREI